MHTLPVEFEVTKNKFNQERIVPVIQCENMSEALMCNGHGFKAEWLSAARVAS